MSYIGVIAVSKVLFHCISRSYARQACRLHVGGHAKCPLELWGLNWIVTHSGLQWQSDTDCFIKIYSAFLQLLHEDRRTGSNEENKRHIFVVFLPERPPTVTGWMYIVGVTERQSDCHVRHLTVQHIYCTNTVQTVQSATELYLQ
jgi:hypothetical protein